MKRILKVAVFLCVALSCAAVFAKPKKIVSKWSEPGVENDGLFKTFGGCGVQIWQDEWNSHDATFSIDYAEGKITVGKVGWWGGSFGAYQDGVPNGGTFNLSKVAKIEFDAKASTYGTIYFNIDDSNKNEIDIPTDFKHYEIPVKKAKAKAESLFAIGGVRDLNKEGCEIFIKNIAFYDAKGNEIVPEYN